MPYEYPEESMEGTPVETPDEITVDGYTYPTDKWGHAKIPDNQGGWITTDPYHHLSYSFGFDVEDASGMYDFLICLDFLILEAHVAFHAVRDTDSGGFIETADYRLVRHDKAVEEAGDWAYWAMDEVSEVYALNVVGDLTEDYDQYPPSGEKFYTTREKFIETLRKCLAVTPPPKMGYSDDEED